MRIVNRNAIMVKPKQPYWDWANNLDDESFSTEKTASENPIYLLPERDNDTQLQRWLKKNYLTIFENELMAMWQDEGNWPAVRDYKMFCAWFDVVYTSEVFDLGERPLKVED